MDYSPYGKIDLHIHSRASDGTLSPAEIVMTARNLGLKAIAITDHDTVRGAKEAINTGIPSDINFLAGVEISAGSPESFPCSGSFHLLGYLIRLDDSALNEMLEILQKSRKNRNPRIIQRLNDLGFDISTDELLKTFGKSQIGRPHIARLMKRKGFISTISEAFDQYLGRGKPAYVDKYRVDCADAISVIRNAGGIPVLAHPGLLRLVDQSTPLENLIDSLRQMGLEGIEVYYPEHSPRETRQYEAIARQFDLLMTGGTDFHGALKPDIRIGMGKGNFSVPYELYERLLESRI